MGDVQGTRLKHCICPEQLMSLMLSICGTDQTEEQQGQKKIKMQTREDDTAIQITSYILLAAVDSVRQNSKGKAEQSQILIFL